MPLERERTIDNPTWRYTFTREMNSLMEAAGFDYAHITVLSDVETALEEFDLAPGNAPGSQMLN